MDPNRPLGSHTLIRDVADDIPIAMNTAISQADRDWRLWRYYIPYHVALGSTAQAINPSLILSCHSFNSVYEGSHRDFQVGVLCSSAGEEAMAQAVVAQLQSAGFQARLNEPWSGGDGFMYAADCLKISGRPRERAALMIEVRNDVLGDHQWRSHFIHALTAESFWREKLLPLLPLPPPATASSSSTPTEKM